MNQSPLSTPFGRRSLTLAMVAAQKAAVTGSSAVAVPKWKLYRAIAETKPAHGLSDRTLSVLNALLSCHPETDLAPGRPLVVFPSNRELSLRAHGMAAATLRRHLSALVEAGFVVRRDSPNGKRYARKGEDGAIDVAFGFDLAPLVARATEFERLAAEARAEARCMTRLRETISLCRRDIAKARTLACENSLDPDALAGALPAIPLLRRLGRGELEALAGQLAEIRDNLFKALSSLAIFAISSASDSHDERLLETPKSDSPIKTEDLKRDLNLKENEAEGRDIPSAPTVSPQPAGGSSEQPISAQQPLTSGRSLRRRPATPPPAAPPRAAMPRAALPKPCLRTITAVCPQIALLARGPLQSWCDLFDAAERSRRALSISESGWKEAVAVMGPDLAAVSVAVILERIGHIHAPGGYLRHLTDLARERPGDFSALLLARLEAPPPGNPRARPAACQTGEASSGVSSGLSNSARAAPVRSTMVR